jgi:hypothetical protein
VAHEHPQVAVIDNLLANEALQKLQHYCWASTIWPKVHPNGYLDAMASVARTNFGRAVQHRR